MQDFYIYGFLVLALLLQVIDMPLWNLK